MKNVWKIFLIITAALLLAGGYFWPYVKMEFAQSAVYTEQDQRKYHFYTPEVLKDLPRISGDYKFAYAQISGSGQLVYEVKFLGTTDVSRLHAYLIERGYRRVGECNREVECWRGREPDVTINIGIIPQRRTVIVSLIDGS